MLYLFNVYMRRIEVSTDYASMDWWFVSSSTNLRADRLWIWAEVEVCGMTLAWDCNIRLCSQFLALERSMYACLCWGDVIAMGCHERKAE